VLEPVKPSAYRFVRALDERLDLPARKSSVIQERREDTPFGRDLIGS